MKIVQLCVALLLFATASCTKSKTDYEAEIETVVPEHYDYAEAVSMDTGGYKISIETLNGTFYKGYNELHLKVTNKQSKEAVQASDVTFLPIKKSYTNGSDSSCPHQYELKYDTDSSYFTGYVVFTDTSDADGSWQLYLSFTIAGQAYSVSKEITVAGQTNKNLNMTSFTGKDGTEYVIALVSPQKPEVGTNDLVAGIYRYNPPTQAAGTFPDPSQFSYSIVQGYTLAIDPRMPEPSMGNHSSPNNVDLTQQGDSLYHGVVNYTMTGNWTLNFIMTNQNGQILKGTVVPTTFTPGVEGVKSELYIDILF